MTNLIKWINEGDKTDEHMRFLLEAEDYLKRHPDKDWTPERLWDKYNKIGEFAPKDAERITKDDH